MVPAALARTGRDSKEELERDIANHVAEGTDALFVVPTEGYLASGNATGTGHGTPWLYDRDVPVLAFGAGVSASHSADVAPQARVAATIAALLSLPWHPGSKPFPGSPVTRE